MLSGMHARRPKISPKWRSQTPEDIMWVVYDDDFIAYHRPSGKTHFLNAASYLLVCEILNEPMDFEDIAKEFASNDIDGDPDGYLEEMTSLLDRLEALGLIERV